MTRPDWKLLIMQIEAAAMTLGEADIKKMNRARKNLKEKELELLKAIRDLEEENNQLRASNCSEVQS